MGQHMARMAFQYGFSLYSILLFTVHYFTDEKKYHE